MIGKADDRFPNGKQLIRRAAPRSELIRRKSADDCCYVDPSARLNDLGAQIEHPFAPATYNPPARLIYRHVGHVAEPGDRIAIHGLEIVVAAAEGHHLIEASLNMDRSMRHHHSSSQHGGHRR